MSPDPVESIKRRYVTLRQPKLICVLKLQDQIISSIRDFLRKEGFFEILAPIIGPVTDPGIRGASQVSIDYYGAKFKVMSSMILYKQMVLASLPKVFALSPNIRIEPLETVKTRRHLTEFRQVDIEEAYATYQRMMQLGEKMLFYTIEDVKRKRENELKQLGRKIETPKVPFKRYSYDEAIEVLQSIGYNVKYGDEIPWDAEEAISSIHKEPFWITDYPITARGFYYLEHPDRRGILRDFDLLYPEGFGEAISGGEREYKYENVMKRIEQGNEDPAKYAWYLEMIKEGVPPSSGFGIGIERLTRYICGVDCIWDAVPFPKVAGVISP